MAVPPDLCWEIGHISPQETRLNLLALNWDLYRLLRPLVYRHIVVGSRARKLIRSLAHNVDLPPLVRSLVFQDEPGPRLDPAQWDRVLCAMSNLRNLIIAPDVPLDIEMIPRLPFRLRHFGAHSSVGGPWAQFIATQPELEELAFNDDFLGTVPSSAQLPLLCSIKGRPADLSKFALAEQLVALFNAAPKLVKPLEHIVLDEDLTWFHFERDPQGPLLHLAVLLNDQQRPVTSDCSS
ncbi:hypothetical protein DFH07DRAFT_953168 [Mycena maculata]|uniref:Uncharacterized protein n=1 Tax=Mycena maculata TaxID=230809 RepID=A0AAD7JVN0_9AGAR|nr:hypothetical protein DFH07DRAFT_953168 [Mycena maculata]